MNVELKGGMTFTSVQTVTLRLRLAHIGIVLLVLGGLGNSAKAQDAFCQIIEVPGASLTLVSGINNNGDVVGSYWLPGDTSGHGFTYSGGTFTTIDVPGGDWTQAYGINDAGDVVGIYWPHDQVCCMHSWYGFVRTSAGGFDTIDVGRFETDPRGINIAGQIVGFYHDSGGDIEDASRGFLLDQSGVTHIDVPGGGQGSQIYTQPGGINNHGVVVGWGYNYTNFIWYAGQFTFLGADPGAAVGINDDGTIVSEPANSSSYIVEPEDDPSIFSCPDTDVTHAEGINLNRAVAGWYSGGGQFHSFVTPRIALVDPVSDAALLSGAVPPAGSGITTNQENLARLGQIVQGVAADGVSRLIVRIAGFRANDVVTLTVLNSSHNTSSSTDEDGGLGQPSDTTYNHQVTVTAVNTSLGPFALAVFRAPIDFSRLSADDSDAVFRDVFIQARSGSNQTTVPVRIVRPLVVLIHGIWADKSTWNPFVLGGMDDRRFKVQVSDYGSKRVNITTSQPYYPLTQLIYARANSLGFFYNAGTVAEEIDDWIRKFRNGDNKAGISVAAIQADVIAHSMGGDVTRAMVYRQGFLRGENFGEGFIHKVITIDTPHLGTPVASRMVTSQEQGGCLEKRLATGTLFVFQSVSLIDRDPARQSVCSDFTLNFCGAVGDMADRVSDGHMSPALRLIAGSSPHPVPFAMVSGEFTNWHSLDSAAGAVAARKACGQVGQDPLAQQLTADGWPAIFGPQHPANANDALVSVLSQGNGVVPLNAYTDLVHSSVLNFIGFTGTSVLQSYQVDSAVISLLNTSVRLPLFQNVP